MAYNFTKGPTFVQDLKAAIQLVWTGIFTTLTATDLVVTNNGAKGGTVTVSAGQATANLVDIATGFSTITGFSLLVLRSGVNVLGDAVVTVTAGTIRVADGSTYNTTAADVIKWTAIGTL